MKGLVTSSSTQEIARLVKESLLPLAWFGTRTFCFRLPLCNKDVIGYCEPVKSSLQRFIRQEGQIVKSEYLRTPFFASLIRTSVN